MFATKPKDARDERKARAKQARDEVAALEAEIKGLEKEIKAHDKDVAKIKKWLKKHDEWGRTELSNQYVVSDDGKVVADWEAGAARVRHGRQLESDLGSAKRKLILARKRAAEREAQAEPLSDVAREALGRLAAEAVLRDELAARSQTLPSLKTEDDRRRLLALAADYGIRPGG